MKISVNFTEQEKENLRDFHRWLENPCKLIEECDEISCTECPIAVLKMEQLNVSDAALELQDILETYVHHLS